LPALQRAQSSSASLRVHGSEFSRELSVLSGRLSGSNANLNGPISATGMPSKSKNLVSSGKSANGDLDMVTTSNTENIPQGKGEVQFARRTQPVDHEAVDPNSRFGKTTVNFIKSVHTRAPKTLNLYTKHMVYDGISGRNEKDLEMMLATMSRVSKSGIQPQRGFLNYTPSEGR